MNPALALLVLPGALAVAGCSSPATPGGTAPTRPVTLAKNVDLQRVMGDWYVIAAIPTSPEKDAYNAKESYRLEPDGRVAITFTFNEGAFTGPSKTMTSTGFPDKTDSAVWGVQFVWPIKADYRISYFSADGQQIVVAREKRDYVWIMARTPQIAEADYNRLVAHVAREGYDAGRLRRVPQASGR